MSAKLGLVVCANLHRELRAVLDPAQNPDVVQLAFSSEACLGGGDRGSLEERLREAASQSSPVFFVAGHCARGVDERLEGLGCEVVRLGECLPLLMGRPLTDLLIEQGAFVVTPGWLRGWRRHLERWQLEGALAREFFAESAAKIVLADTGVDEGAGQNLLDFADHVGLGCETIVVGLDLFRAQLMSVVSRWREASVRQLSVDEQAASHRRASDLELALEVASELIQEPDERAILERISQVFQMLFAPGRLFLGSLAGGELRETVGVPSAAIDVEDYAGVVAAMTEEYQWTDDRSGFRLAIVANGEILAFAEAEGFGLPEYREHYLNLALTLTRVCGLAISRARAEAHLTDTIESLKQALDEIGTLRGLIPVCAWCHKVRDDKGYWNTLEAYFIEHGGVEVSHGICPECVAKHFTNDDDAQGST